ncbi:unnamed protein product [Didymodactylos carnosus]|uniref:nicotinamidase n=1 Tax=Didymodactylos carnosus TaxID=1234261 RepID=A0A814WUA2_9BILA|nr:unnamed protein product [Didymodactylos carnosus]CAF1259473.1 unnamed protein product [Didymodactylos carnosus]CAF3971121.1 unnamed protein product [Didymodactylos carnosus]CAF4066308.1 unnamed protein product [Didymodactylos carnosus]
MYFILAITLVFASSYGQYSVANQLSSAGTAKRTVNALLVIDVQNCFISGSLALPHSPADVIPIINNLLKTIPFDLVVYSHDWHPSNHISFFNNLNDRRQYIKPGTKVPDQPYQVVTYTGPKVETEQMLWPTHCVQNTGDANLHASLVQTTLKGEIFHVRKGIDPDLDSYSAFYDNQKLYKTELDDILRQRNVTRVFVVGLATDYCVAYTALDANDLNYATYVVEDACRGVTNASVQAQIAYMKRQGVKIIHSNEVRSLISGAALTQLSFSLMLAVLFVFYFTN